MTWLRLRSRSVPGLTQPPCESLTAPEPMMGRRPILTIVIPDRGDREEQYDRSYKLGHALGEFFNHGSAEDLASLAPVDLRCAAESELVLPEASMGSGPFAVLVTAASRSRLVRFDLPELSRGWDDREDNERLINERIQAIAGAVWGAVMVDGKVFGTTHHGRDEVVADLIAELRQDAPGADVAGAQDTIPTSLADRHAAALLEATTVNKGYVRTAIESALASVVRDRWVYGQVTGAEWAKTAGCGVTFEERDTNVAIGCGMGHVPERSQRFLYFYTLDKLESVP